jgi:hypothetical protein
MQSKVLDIIQISWILMRCRWDGEEIFILNHLGAYTGTELFHLFPNVSKESITRLAS